MNEEIQTPPEYEVDLSRLPEVRHRWVKRGVKISCEGAGHPHHSHFLVERERDKHKPLHS